MAFRMIGRKVGMTRLYDGGGRVRAVTAIELGPNRVTQLRTLDRDGYEAVQVGYTGNGKRMTRPARGHLRKAGIEEQLNALVEFRADVSDFTAGEELKVDRFVPGEFVDVTGTSKGRGFAGGVKRWGFRGGPKTHGQTDKHRGAGSIGAGTTPGRVWKGQKMAGHMGAVRKTVRNLLVVLIDPSRNLIFVEGSVPGPNKGIVSVTPARRPALAEFEAPAAPPPADEPEAVEEVAPVEDALEVTETTAENAADETAGEPAAVEGTDAADDTDSADDTDMADDSDDAESGDGTAAAEADQETGEDDESDDGDDEGKE